MNNLKRSLEIQNNRHYAMALRHLIVRVQEGQPIEYDSETGVGRYAPELSSREYELLIATLQKMLRMVEQ